MHSGTPIAASLTNGALASALAILPAAPADAQWIAVEGVALHARHDLLGGMFGAAVRVGAAL